MGKITIDLDEITQQLDELYDQKARLKFELKQVEKEIDKLEPQLQALLGQLGTDEMVYKCYSFGWQTKTVNRLNQTLLKEKYPQQYEECYLPSVSKSFEFKINK